MEVGTGILVGLLLAGFAAFVIKKVRDKDTNSTGGGGGGSAGRKKHN